jgi:hypothetical protein
MFRLRLFACIHKGLASVVLSALLLQVMGALLVQLALFWPLTVGAAPVTIDSTATAAAGSNNVTGSQVVFIDDDVGYAFYRDSTNQCVYSKTTDSGLTWNTPVLVDSQTDCLKIVVWYDRWTPGDTIGNFIHIATLDNGDDDMFYNRLDVTTDTLLLGSSPVNASINSAKNPSISVNINTHAITKATDGEIYLAVNDGGDAYAVSCASNCNLTTSWNEVGTSPFDAQNDNNLLMPLSGGDIMAINRDLSADDIRYTIWNGSTWSSWAAIDTNAPESATFDGGIAATVNVDTNDIYLVYAADNNNNTPDHDIRTAYYDGASWTNTTDILTNVPGRGVRDVAIGLDQNTGDVYVTYNIEDTIGSGSSANIYYATSTDNMSTWSGELGPLTTVAGDYYGPMMTLNNFERMYATWWNGDNSDFIGETVANIGPDTLLAASGTMAVTVRATSTGFYTGGVFVLTSQSSRSVSSIRITETGTIDGDTELENIKLFYDIDTTAPYDCTGESYSPADAQFGATDTNGFSGPDGGSTFAGTVVNVNPTQAVCFYPVLDINSAADDGDTIALEVTDPAANVSVSGTTVFPSTAVALSGSTTVVSPNLTQAAYHWRADDGSEAAATSLTSGAENTPLTALSKTTPLRLRMAISNEGSTSSLATAYRLEYGTAAPTCADTTVWTDVGVTDDAWNLFDSPNLTNAADTTNIAPATGGVTDPNTTFLTPNAGVLDTTSITSPVVLETTEFVELEYSLVASSSAVEGETYCFRVTGNGAPLSFYDTYPSATIDADVRVSATGTQAVNLEIPNSNQYFGGTFVIRENVSTRNVTDIVVTEIGTIDASIGLANIRLFYDLDQTAPYNCVSESYGGGETQFGAADVDGFSAANGSSTFSDTVAISTTSSMCVYVVADITTQAVNGDTVQFEISSPSSDVTVSGAGTVAPATPVTLNGSTTLQGGVLTQTHYHWRNDDGSESGATSATGGVEDTPLIDFDLSENVRLRFGVSNEGSTTSIETRYRLEFSPKITTCDAVTVWTDVDAVSDDWDMFDSPNLTNAADTTNIAVANGGVTDENTTFLTPNGGVRDTESLTASTTLATDEHVDIEFSITSSATTLNDTTYCFRLSANGTALQAYDTYAEVTTVPKRDFRVQRGNVVVSGTSTTLVAGVDYTAPSATSAAFIRITNTHHTGAGNTSGGGASNADDVTAYIVDPENLLTSVTIGRFGTFRETYVDWEIVEFVGIPGTDNEMIVRDVGVITMDNGTLNATGTAVSVSDDADVVVFMTGIRNQNTSRNYYAGHITTEWSSSTNQPTFTRGATGNAFVDFSYAVVEYTGLNWNVQRVEHAYTAAGVTETESITPVNSLARTFLHTQKRMGAGVNVADFGHTVWLSSIGAVSFELDGSASVLIEQTSVAWVIENTQTGNNAMDVQRQNGSTVNGSEPLTLTINMPSSVNAANNASIFMNSRAGGTNTAFPRPIAGVRITSNSTYDIWRSDTGTTLDYRVEIVQWPVADLALRQNYYRFYVDDDSLTPNDPWPPGVTDLGENTSITVNDEPIGEGQFVRLRMTVRIANSNVPAGFASFNLQYAERTTTCSAATLWNDVGQIASSTIWSGFAGTSTVDGTALSSDPPTPGDLLISLSDVAGTLEHENPSAPNPHVVFDGEDIEYDWYVKHNGATPDTNYCFRMVRSDGSELDGYFNYPQIRTAGFSPATRNWRWYDDPENETPTSALAAENVAPSNIVDGDTLALRVTVYERANVNNANTKFKLQFSDDISFTNPVDVVATSSCQEASLWCYIDGGGVDNALISSSTLSDAESCVGATGNGCGTHNASADFVTGFAHGGNQAKEYSFTIRAAAPRVNGVYYFRLVEADTLEVVSLDSGESLPSLVSGGSALTFSINGLPAGTSTASVVTDATTTATAVDFGLLTFNDDAVAAQRLSVTTNATEGYRVLKYATQQMLNDYGDAIADISGTNAAPQGWATACAPTSTGCFGYHTTDAILSGGSARFAPADTYAAVSATPAEIIYSSSAADVTEDVVYRIQVTEMQPAGQYRTDIVYLAIPVF